MRGSEGWREGRREEERDRELKVRKPPLRGRAGELDGIEWLAETSLECQSEN